jgi:hypothetical protein
MLSKNQSEGVVLRYARVTDKPMTHCMSLIQGWLVYLQGAFLQIDMPSDNYDVQLN